MLEERKYTRAELSAVLGTDVKRYIDRKLRCYDIDFVSKGRGNDLVYDIQKINNPFKLYCIIEMGISANADFTKLRNLFYYILSDDDFAVLPLVEMERILKKDGMPIARQTITKWQEHLSSIGYFYIDRTNCVYYAITKTPDNQKIYTKIPKELYLKGWHLYWKLKDTHGVNYAYSQMYYLIGGPPCKRPDFEENACHQKEIKTLIKLVNEAFLE